MKTLILSFCAKLCLDIIPPDSGVTRILLRGYKRGGRRDGKGDESPQQGSKAELAGGLGLRPQKPETTDCITAEMHCINKILMNFLYWI